MNTERQLRVAIVKVDSHLSVNNEAMVDVLRPHLHWEILTDEEWRALARGMNSSHNWTILVDHSHEQNQTPIASIDEALAWVAEDELRRQKQGANQATGVAAEVLTVKPKKKALTAKQRRELEALRQELGDSSNG